MRVAVCISGQPREGLESYPYILKNIIEPNKADVFIHMNYDINNLYILKSHADNGKCLLEVNLDKKLIELYKPKKYLIESPRNYGKPTINVPEKRLNNFIQMNKHKNWSKEEHKNHMINNSLSMFYSIYKCNELKEIYSNENNFVYDYVIRLRFDTVPRQILKCSNYDPNYIYYQEMGQKDELISDWINFGSNLIMNIYSSIWLNFEYLNTFKFYKKNERQENTLEPSDICGGMSEHMIRDLMYLYKIPKKGFNIGTTLGIYVFK